MNVGAIVSPAVLNIRLAGRRGQPGRKLGAVEEWTIVNTHVHDDHVFHIHTNPFQVTQVNGQRQTDLLWRDSVIVPRKGG